MCWGMPCHPGAPTTQNKASQKYIVASILPLVCHVCEIQEASTRYGKSERLFMHFSLPALEEVGHGQSAAPLSAYEYVPGKRTREPENYP